MSRLHMAIAAIALPVLLVGGFLLLRAEQIMLGGQAYVFGFPLVIMDLTRIDQSAGIDPANPLRRLRVFPDATFKAVVRPNVDTLYSSAFIDLQAGPWLFEMPANHQRYELMAFMDGWTNVFASPGSRTSNGAGGRYLLAGPRWHGEVPAGMQLLRAPTRMVWLIGRTETRGSADYPTVHRLQDGLVLRPLDPVAGAAAVRASPAPADPAGADAPRTRAAPLELIRQMAVQDFFERLADLMVDNPPAAADAPMRAQLERLGIAPGQRPRWDWSTRWAVTLGRALAEWKIARELQSRPRRQGWITPPAVLGNYGTNYPVRAVVAMIGLGANLPQDAIYPSTQVDQHDAPLHGKHRYRLHFSRGAPPLVGAFWSLSAYGMDDYFIANPLGRHALGSHDALASNPDGSLDLWLQAGPPAPALRGNWLPVRPDAHFQLLLRLYGPQPAALDGRWTPPAVQRVD